MSKKPPSPPNKFFAHFKTIKEDQPKFILWVLTSIFLATSSVWVPSLLGAIVGHNYYEIVMANNPLVIISIVFLSNAILNSISKKNSGTNDFSVTLRAIGLVVTIMYLLFLSAIIPLKAGYNVSVPKDTQFILLGVAIFLGVYMYGFREVGWEKDVGEFVKNEDKDLNKMKNKANDLTEVEGIKI